MQETGCEPEVQYQHFPLLSQNSKDPEHFQLDPGLLLILRHMVSKPLFVIFPSALQMSGQGLMEAEIISHMTRKLADEDMASEVKKSVLHLLCFA